MDPLALRARAVHGEGRPNLGERITVAENEIPKSPLEMFEELAAQAPGNVMVRYSLGRE